MFFEYSKTKFTKQFTICTYILFDLFIIHTYKQQNKNYLCTKCVNCYSLKRTILLNKAVITRIFFNIMLI